MRKILFFLGFSFSLFCGAQNIKVPDYPIIEKAVSDSNSVFFYPDILEKYYSGAHNLSLEEKRHLYYGYIFQESYAPYTTSLYEDSARSLWKKEELTTGDYQKIIRYADRMLAEDPFNTHAIQYKTVALFKLGMSGDQEYDRILNQYYTIMDAILSSGEGTTIKNAYYVTNLQHEYALLSHLDYIPKGQSFKGLSGQYFDYITVEDNPSGIDGFYFEVTPCQQYLLSYPKKKAVSQQNSKKNKANAKKQK